jgi:hypothetical protein
MGKHGYSLGRCAGSVRKAPHHIERSGFVQVRSVRKSLKAWILDVTHSDPARESASTCVI